MSDRASPAPRTFLLLLLVVVLAVLAIWWPFGDSSSGIPAGDTEASTGVDSKLAAPKRENPKLGDEADTKSSEAPVEMRSRRAPKTIVRGLFEARPGTLVAPGKVVLVKPPELEGKGPMELFSMGVNAARERRFRRQEKRNASTSRDRDRRLVALFGLGEPVASAELTSSGAFVVEDPPAGRYRVQIRHPHLLNARPVTVTIREGDDIDLGVLPTRLAGSLLVLVFDPYGAPIRGASLELRHQLDMKKFMSPSGFGDMSELMKQIIPLKAKTDARGAHRFEAVELGRQWRLAVTANNLVPAHQDVQLVPGRERVLRVELSGGASLDVDVRNVQGEPVLDTRVIILYPNLPNPELIGMGGTREQQLLTRRFRVNSHGVARARGLLPGEVVVSVHPRGYRPATRRMQLTSGSNEAVTLSVQRGTTISGTVTDPDGKPIAGAFVVPIGSTSQRFMGMDVSSFVTEIETLRARDREVETDDNGNFTIGGFEANEKVNLAADADRFDRAQVTDVSAGSTGVKIVLQPAVSLSGAVVSEPDGTPIPSFEVALMQRMFLVFDRTILSREFDDAADGRFEFDRVPRDRFSVVVRAKGRADWTGTADFRDGSVDLGEVRLALPARIEGRTLGPDGAVLAGVSVRVARGGAADSLMMSKLLGQKVVESDAKGHFVLENLAGTKVRLLADQSGLAPLRTKVVRLEPGKTTQVVLHLAHGGRIHGRLVDSRGRPLAGWRAQATHTSGSSMRMTETDENGEFVLDGLGTGTHKVDCTPMDAWIPGSKARPNPIGPKGFDLSKMMTEVSKWMVSDRVVVKRGETAEVRLVFDDPDAVEGLSKLVTVQGTVTVGGVPLRRGALSFAPAGSTSFGKFVEVVNGAFRVPRVRPGSYRVVVQSGAFSATIGQPRVFDVPERPTFRIDLKLPGGRITGTVVYEPNQEPASGIVLSLRSAHESGAGFERMDIGEGTQLSDRDGRFQFDGLAPGEYELFAKQLQSRGSARLGRVSGITLAADERRDGVVVPLLAGGSLTVVARDSKGPVASAIVRLLTAAGKPLDLFHRRLTDEDGTAVFSDLPAGEYRVNVDASKRAPQVSQRISVEQGREQRVEVALVEGTPAQLFVGGLPDTGTYLVLYSLWRADGTLVTTGRAAISRSLVRDGLALGSFSPGRYHVRVESQSFGVISQEVTVPRSGTARWTVELPQRGKK